MVIEVKDLKFTYSPKQPDILNIPYFSMKKGEKVFLYGPSGCGKTTFLESIAGVISPQSGRLKISGNELVGIAPGKRDKLRADHIGYIFQNFNLIPYLSVFENIVLPLQFSESKRKKVPNVFESATQIAQALGIGDLLKKRTTELSVGQQQRVAAARAVLGEPDLILADEPTSALDYDYREKFISLLFEACKIRKVSVLFVSHDKTLLPLFDRSVALPDINQREV